MEIMVIIVNRILGLARSEMGLVDNKLEVCLEAFRMAP